MDKKNREILAAFRKKLELEKRRESKQAEQAQRRKEQERKRAQEAREAELRRQAEESRIAERARIVQEAESRGITWFVHFTQVSNLGSILDNGLLTRDELAKRKMSFAASDPNRYEQIGDNEGNDICLSVMFPNYRMFYSKRMENEDVNWCVLLLDARKVLGCCTPRFFSANAASVECRNEGGIDCESFKKLFGPTSEGRDREELQIPDYMTTNPQAELQVPCGIRPSCICGVVFESQADWDRWKSDSRMRGKKAWSKEWLDTKRGGVWESRRYFAPRMDYRHWQD